MKDRKSGLVSGYEVTQELLSNRDENIYRAYSQQDQTTVVIKVFRRTGKIELREVARFRQEYRITQYLDIKEVLKPIRLEENDKNLILTYEDFNGIFLSNVLIHQRFQLSQFLNIAL
ncbi:hypothetical protein H6F86_25035 [Phormidium sp. FACHB-592]|uniref:Protein kinase domain-containing protein n=1 Tax=Stenomitos frigidus AS-A4 TaxID=2933935 RepID=A0ABV0KQ31_9CYAN|nr:hypothetical protein [Phormidium sp. FACHB-592]MBD2077089.1 hypothetical protein [Phormidium sp. FACHB-592]